MGDLNLELNHTYLLQIGSSDTISSATILMKTDKAYLIRWNRGLNGNDTWELKDKMYRSYNIVEDISDYVIDTINNESEILKFKPTWKDCPECGGKGWIQDNNTTIGRSTCTRCWGSGKVIDVVETN